MRSSLEYGVFDKTVCHPHGSSEDRSKDRRGTGAQPRYGPLLCGNQEEPDKDCSRVMTLVAFHIVTQVCDILRR